jgi:arylsulfatase A-like enzyme
MDGRSLLPAATNPAFGINRDLLFESELANIHSDGLVSGSWKYIEHSTGERELYDLQSDPWELTNRASNPGYAAIRAQLAARLAQLKNCSGTACP